MAFADSSAARMAAAPESSYGVNPAAGATFVRFTSDSLSQATATTVSEEIGGDRNPRETIRTNLNAEGDINFEFSENNFELFLEAALGNRFGAVVSETNQAIDISSTTGGTFTLTDAGTSDAFANAVVGQWLRLSNFDNNGTIYARVVTKASNNVVHCQGRRENGDGVTNEAGQTDIDIDGRHLKIGSEKISFTIERQWTDISLFDLFTGMMISAMTMTISPEEIINGSISFLGAKQEEFGSSQIGTIAAAGDENVANAIDNIEGVFEGTFITESPLCITELSWSIDNNLRTQLCIGNLGAVGIGAGVSSITGTLTAFLEDATQINKYLNFTESKLSFRIEDPDGRVTIFTFPAIKFTSGQNVVSSNAADGLVELEWGAQKEDGVSNSAFHVDTFPTLAGVT